MSAQREALPGALRDQSLAATRQRILAVALELIAAQGFAATSTRQISERLGFSKAALYYHFRTKNDLLQALVQPSIDQFSSLVDDGEQDRSPNRKTTVLAGYVDLVADHEELTRVLSQDPEMRKSPGSSTVTPLYERLTRLLTDEAEPNGALRAQVRAALAGVHAVFIYAAPGDDRQMLRTVALETASRALGLA